MAKKIISAVMTVLLLLSAVVIPAGAAGGKKAVIIVPGIAGSELYAGSESEMAKIWVGPAILRIGALACDNSGEPVTGSIKAYDKDDAEYGTANAYGALTNALKETFSGEYDVVFFPYDWRLSSEKSARELEKLVSQAGYGSIMLIGHSMGGLVCSAYAAKPANKAKIEKVIAIGTPFLGTPKTLETFETGRMADSLKADGVTGDILKGLVKNFPALYELLPSSQYYEYGGQGMAAITKEHGPAGAVDEIAGYQATAEFIGGRSFAQGKPLIKNAQLFHDSLYSGGTHVLLDGMDSYFIAGTGRATGAGYTYAADEDSNITGITDLHKAANGDGMVNTLSATIGGKAPKNRTYYFEDEHQALVSDGRVIELVKQILSGTQQKPAPAGAICPGFGDMRIKLTGRAELTVTRGTEMLAQATASECKVYSPMLAGASCFNNNQTKDVFLNTASADIGITGNATGVFDLEIDLLSSGGQVKTRYLFDDVAINPDITGKVSLSVGEEPRLVIRADGGEKEVAPDTVTGRRISGDTDTSGEVNVLDALNIQKYLADFLAFNRAELAVSDISGDGAVNVKDVLAIQRQLAAAG